MLSKKLQDVLNSQVDPETLAKKYGRSTPWRDQIAVVSFWFCAVACLLLVGYQSLGSFNFSTESGLKDYGSLYASGSLANLHVNPYRDHPLVSHIRDVDRHGPYTPLQGNRVNAINLNPPVVLYLFRLLARLDPKTSYVTWACVSAGLFIASVLLVLRTYPAKKLRIRVLWILSMGAVWHTFQLGQIYMILLFCAAIAWWALREHKWLAAGISIGIICAIKPNFLVWPGLLIAGKSKKTGFTAFATTGLLSAIPLFLQGPLIYRQWLAACQKFNGYELPGNSSLLSICSRAGIPQAGFALTFLVLAAVTIWILVTKPEPLFTSQIGILTSLIAGPISWLGYTILLIPVMYSKKMDTWTRIGCVMLCIPVWVFLPNADTSRITYILFWAPNIYALALLTYSAVRSGTYCEEAEDCCAVRHHRPSTDEFSKTAARANIWNSQSFAASRD